MQSRRLISLLFLFWHCSVFSQTFHTDLIGISDSLEKRLKPVLSFTNLDSVVSEHYARYLAESDVKTLEQTLLSLGYPYPIIELEWRVHPSEHYEARYHIRLGKPIRLTHLEAQTSLGLPHWIQTLPDSWKMGDILDHDRYENIKNSWLNAALEQGYLDAFWKTHRLEIDREQYTARIDWLLDTGSRYRIGHIHYNHAGLSDDLLQRYLPFHPGDAFLSALCSQAYIDLNASGYFRQVMIIPEPNPQTHEVDIHIKLEPKRPYAWQTSLGFGTDQGLHYSISWDGQRLNPQGHRAHALWLQSRYERLWKFWYTWPGQDPIQTRHTLSWSDQLTHRDEQKADTQMFTYSHTKPWRQAHLTHTWRWYRTRDRLLNQEAYQHRQYLIPGLQWLRQRIDDRLFPRHGHQWDVQLYAGQSLHQSHDRFLQLHAFFKYVNTYSHYRYMLESEIGSTWLEQGDLPLTFRFFAGGDNSVRGFPFHSLSPQTLNASGFPQWIGGEHILVARSTWFLPVYQSLEIGPLLDIGQAFDRHFHPALSTGLAFAYPTPVGALRLAIARPIRTYQGMNSWRFHVHLSPEFS